MNDLAGRLPTTAEVRSSPLLEKLYRSVAAYLLNKGFRVVDEDPSSNSVQLDNGSNVFLINVMVGTNSLHIQIRDEDDAPSEKDEVSPLDLLNCVCSPLSSIVEELQKKGYPVALVFEPGYDPAAPDKLATPNYQKVDDLIQTYYRAIQLGAVMDLEIEAVRKSFRHVNRQILDFQRNIGKRIPPYEKTPLS